MRHVRYHNVFLAFMVATDVQVIQMKVFVLGNPAYEPDSLALKVGKELKDQEVVWLENPFHLLETLEKEPKVFEKAIILGRS